MSDPYHQGYMHGLEGTNHNPYEETTWEWVEYENGYEVGYEEDGCK